MGQLFSFASRALLLAVLVALGSVARAQVYRWNSGELIPGTASIVPGPGANFANVDLSFADLEEVDLSKASFYNGSLKSAKLAGATLSGADFAFTWLAEADLSGTTYKGLVQAQLFPSLSRQASSFVGVNFGSNDLRGWSLFGNADLSRTKFAYSELRGAAFGHSTISEADFSQTDFSLSQLYSTQSYEDKHLLAVNFSGCQLPGAGLSGFELSYSKFEAAGLTRADFSGAQLSQSILDRAVLVGANLTNSNLKQATFRQADLTGANLNGAQLTLADLSEAVLDASTFAGAIVTSANLSSTTNRGFSKDKLYSTATYQAKQLSDIRLENNNLVGWDFSGQDLWSGSFAGSNLTDAEFSDANLQSLDLRSTYLNGAMFRNAQIRGAQFGDATSRGFTKEQFYSTGSYAERVLFGVGLSGSDLTGWDLSHADLSYMSVGYAKLAGANFEGSTIYAMRLPHTTSQGFTKEQLYSTASYKQGDLRYTDLSSNDFTGWDLHGLNFSFGDVSRSSFRGANLDRAFFGQMSLGNVAFDGASMREVSFSADLIDVSFADADLRGASLSFTSLNYVSLARANLSGARLGGARFLEDVDFTDAVVAGADFQNATAYGFSKSHLYATASYKNHDLRGTSFVLCSLGDWDLSSQDLRLANFGSANIGNTLFAASDLRGASGAKGVTSYLSRNAILPDGKIDGLSLEGTETLIVRDFDIAVAVAKQFSIGHDARLNLIIEDESWGSKITVAPEPQLGGTLEISWPSSKNAPTLVGKTFDLFDWQAGPLPGNQFDRIQTPAGTLWDLSDLYVGGQAVLSAVHTVSGDVDGDGRVDLTDFGTMKVNFGKVAANLLEGDLNGDSVIDLSDFGTLKANFGKAGSAAVPEPHGMLLAGFGFAAFLFKLRRCRR